MITVTLDGKEVNIEDVELSDDIKKMIANLIDD